MPYQPSTSATMKLSKQHSFIGFRLLAHLSLLFLAGSSSGVAVEGKEIIENEWRSSSEQSVDPLRQQHRLRFALADVELSFWYLPSSTDTAKLWGIASLGTIETATRHFLAHALNEDPTTTVIDLSVRVISQDDSIDPSSATATILDTSSNTDNIAARILTTHLEITIQYALEADSSQLNDMGERITELFSSRPHELLDLLVLLDKAVFGTVFAIGSESSKTPIVFSKKASSDQTRSNDEESKKWQSLGIFVLIGITGLISVGIGLILLFLVLPRVSKKRTRKRRGRRTKKVTMELPIPSVLIKNTITENTSDDPDSMTQPSKIMVLQNDSVNQDTVGKSPGRMGESSAVTITRKRQNIKEKSSNEDTEFAPTTTTVQQLGIQAIYSEDKLRSPLELNIQELRTKKEDAEHNLKSNIAEYCSRWVVTTTDSNNPLQNSQQQPEGVVHRRRTYSSRMRMKEEKHDIESQIQTLKNKRNEIEERLREKYDALIGFLPSESREIEAIPDARVTREDATCRVGPDVFHARVGMIDNDDISALTYGTFSVDGDDEDQEMEVLTIRGKKDYSIKKSSRHRSDTPAGYIMPYHRKASF
eukprot:jgi/Psemu1/4727/gm1.4727_g